MAKLSIIIPFYNSINYVDSIMSAVLNQSYKDYELILVDNGSSDGTLSRLNEYKGQMTNDIAITVMQCLRRGPSAARNEAMKVATGEYIRFLDCDDYISPDSNEIMMEPVEHCECHLVIGNFTADDDSREYFTGEIYAEGNVDPTTFCREFIAEIYSYYYGVVWNKIYFRKIIEDNKLTFDETMDYTEDYDFNVRYFKYCKSIYRVNKEDGIYRYIRQNASITKNLTPYSIDENRAKTLETLKKTMPYCESLGLGHELELKIKFNYLLFRLNDLVDDYGISFVKCRKEFVRETTEEGASEYISQHPECGKSFLHYYLRGVLRKLARIVRGRQGKEKNLA